MVLSTVISRISCGIRALQESSSENLILKETLVEESTPLLTITSGEGIQ